MLLSLYHSRFKGAQNGAKIDQTSIQKATQQPDSKKSETTRKSTHVILPTVSLLFQNKTRFLYKLQLNNIQKHEFSVAKHFLESILYATEHVFDLRNKYFLYVCIRKLRGSQHCTFLPRGMYGSIVICLYLLTQVHNYT